MGACKVDRVRGGGVMQNVDHPGEGGAGQAGEGGDEIW